MNHLTQTRPKQILNEVSKVPFTHQCLLWSQWYRINLTQFWIWDCAFEMNILTLFTLFSFGGAVVRASAFHLWVLSSILAEDFTHHTHVKRVSQRSAESRGFSPGTPVSSHRESWLGGLGQSVTEKPQCWGVNWIMCMCKLYAAVYWNLERSSHTLSIASKISLCITAAILFISKETFLPTISCRDSVILASKKLLFYSRYDTRHSSLALMFTSQQAFTCLPGHDIIEFLRGDIFCRDVKTSFGILNEGKTNLEKFYQFEV